VRLGLFGGSFNPIHLGHLRAAVEVREAFNLDRLLLIPSAHPPHKERRDMAEAIDRLKMVDLAVQNVPFLEACNIELTRPAPSYTIDTLRYFHNHSDPRSAIYFVVGIDAFSEINTWKSYRELLATAHFIVMTRPGPRVKNLQGFIHTNISSQYEYRPESNEYRHPQWYSIFCFDITHLDISATQIREKVRLGRSIRFLVPDAVEYFIMKKGLYK